MNYKYNIELSEIEAKGLWLFLCAREGELDYNLSGIRRQLENRLWDRLSIEEMLPAGSGEGHGDG